MKALVLVVIALAVAACDRMVELSPPPDGPARETALDGPTGDGGANATDDALLDGGLPAD